LECAKRKNEPEEEEEEEEEEGLFLAKGN